MQWTSWVALVGAAAWLPKIIEIFSKPRIKIIPESAIEVGYSFFGPIINPTFAIASSKKDALIEKLELEVVHELGERHHYLWQFIDEKGFEGHSSSGEKVEMRRTQSAIALKVGTVGLVERKIGFQDISFKESRRTLERQLSDKASFLEKTEAGNYPENIFSSKEFLDLERFIDSVFPWKAGKYKISVIIFETSRRKPIIERYEFGLSAADIEILKRNINITQGYIKNDILFRAGKLQNMPLWLGSWVYPYIKRTRS